MTITLERVLTMSAQAYCAMNSIKLNDYYAVGVHCSNGEGIEDFTKLIPDDTEAVVNFIFSIPVAARYNDEEFSSRVNEIGVPFYRNVPQDDVYYCASGVALVPKKR